MLAENFRWHSTRIIPCGTSSVPTPSSPLWISRSLLAGSGTLTAACWSPKPTDICVTFTAAKWRSASPLTRRLQSCERCPKDSQGVKDDQTSEELRHCMSRLRRIKAGDLLGVSLFSASFFQKSFDLSARKQRSPYRTAWPQ